MVNYANSKIYRIVCNTTGKQYIGVTTIPLSTRLSQHKKLFKINSPCCSKEVMEHDDYEIYLIEDYPVERKEQLLARARMHIESNICVNKKSLYVHNDINIESSIVNLPIKKDVDMHHTTLINEMVELPTHYINVSKHLNV